MTPPSPVFLLFSGHNDRAVVALCRFFHRHGLAFRIVAARPADAIFRTAWSEHVVFCRLDARLDLALFEAVVASAQLTLRPGQRLVYCPTTEYMNQFVLDHLAQLKAAGLHSTLPAPDIYARLTSKLDSQGIMADLAGILPPLTLDWRHVSAPCVLKPAANILDDCGAYPKLCRTPAELEAALTGLDRSAWFAQAWVEGQSYYLCGYLARSGEAAWYWQENLLQQPGGKSIVLARTCDNPGVDAAALFAGLHRLGYHGPFMAEIIRDAGGRLYYIEVNPRFWGPLQLALDAGPRVLALFAQDAGAAVSAEPPRTGQHWYAWAQGAREDACRRYPAAEGLGPLTPDSDLLRLNDVYAAADTQALHGRH